MYRGQIVAVVDGRTADRNEVGVLMATGMRQEARSPRRPARRSRAVEPRRRRRHDRPAATTERPAAPARTDPPRDRRHARTPAAQRRRADRRPADPDRDRPAGRRDRAGRPHRLVLRLRGGLDQGRQDRPRPAAHRLPGAARRARLFGWDPIISTLVAATPLVLGGLAVALGFKAGLFNIGVQGQFLMGVLGAVAVGVALADQPVWIAAPLAFLAGHAGRRRRGASSPGWLKAVSGAHEVVTTIMLNYVAVQHPRRGRRPARCASPRRPRRSPTTSATRPSRSSSARPATSGSSSRSRWSPSSGGCSTGRRSASRSARSGSNPDAARYAGMRPRRLIVLTMTIVGGLAGLAGADELLGVTHQTTTSFATTVGFDSIAVALLARSNPIAIIPAALLFGAMRAGAGQMQIKARTPRELVDVLQAMILLVLVALPVLAAGDPPAAARASSGHEARDDHARRTAASRSTS